MESETNYRLLFETARDGILILDGDTGEITDVNPFLLKMLGFSTEEFLGKKTWEINSFSDLKGSPNAFQELHEKKVLHIPDIPLQTKDGHLVHVEFTSNVYPAEGGHIILCNIRDISEQKQAEGLQEAVYRIAIATETANSLNNLYEQIHQIISSVMPAENFYITIYNEEHNTLQFPYFKDILDEPYLGEIEPGKGLTAYVLRTGKSLLCTQAVHDELERQGAVILLGEPSAIWLGVPLIIERKTIGAMVVQHYSDPQAYGEREQHMLEFVSSQVAVAISRKQVEEALRASETSFRALVEQIPAVTYIDKADKSAISLFVSPQIESMLGISQQEWIQGDINFWAGMIHPEDRDRVVTAYLHTIDTGQPFGEEYRIRTKDRREIWIDDHAVLLKTTDHQTSSLHGVMFDITERKRADERLIQLSIHDILTGLYNRGFFEEQLRRLEHGREFPVSVVMADVDHLKETNDTKGHAAGDALLKRVAWVLTSAFRVEDVVARIGGDEFAILLPNTDRKASEDVLLRIRQILKEHNAAQPESPLELSLGASTAEKNTSLADVLKEADRRMYTEKQKHEAS